MQDVLVQALVGAGLVSIPLLAHLASVRSAPRALSKMELALGTPAKLCVHAANRKAGTAIRSASLRFSQHAGHMPAPRGRHHLFAEPLRSTWHAVDGEYYYIDAHGRPAGALTILPQPRPGRRRLGIQRRVGRMADRLCPDGYDYDGGHLIGAQLGGYGRRANLVPQAIDFNRGLWKQCENAIAKALPRLNGRGLRLAYYVRVRYEGRQGTVPIPSHMGMLLCVLRRSDQRSALAWLLGRRHRAKATKGPWQLKRSCYIELVNRGHGGHWVRRWLTRSAIHDILRG